MKLSTLHILLVTSISLLAVQMGSAQIGQLLRSIAKNSAKTTADDAINGLGKNAIKGSDDFVPAFSKLRLSGNLSEGLKNNFHKFNASKEVKIKHIDEIEQNADYPFLKGVICKKLKINDVKKSVATHLLLGGSYNGSKLDSNLLYKIYFDFSSSFAKEELHQLMAFYKCGATELAEINDIAAKRNVILDSSICDEEVNNNEDSGIIEIIFVIIFLSLIGYLFYKYWDTILALVILGIVGYLLYLLFIFIKGLFV